MTSGCQEPRQPRLCRLYPPQWESKPGRTEREVKTSTVAFKAPLFGICEAGYEEQLFHSLLLNCVLILQFFSLQVHMNVTHSNLLASFVLTESNLLCCRVIAPVIIISSLNHAPCLEGLGKMWIDPVGICMGIHSVGEPNRSAGIRPVSGPLAFQRLR